MMAPLKRKVMALMLLPLILSYSFTTIADCVSVINPSQTENCLSLASVALVSTSPTPEPKIFSTYWDAPPGVITQSPTIIVLSPQENDTYSTDDVSLQVNVGSENWVINSIYYEADWREGIHRIFTVQDQPNLEWALRTSLTVNFTGVPNGSHSITVYANLHNHEHGSSTVHFTTNAPLPRISGLSIENRTYYTRDLPLEFTVDKPTSWLGYSLDGDENITIMENKNLQGLSYGQHSIIVYANDTSGNFGSSEKIYFSVSQEAFPIVLVAIAFGTSFCIIGIGLVIYFRKRNR
jgi:hypothetical protein